MKKLILILSIFSLLGLQSVKSEEMYIGIDYLNNEISMKFQWSFLIVGIN